MLTNRMMWGTLALLIGFLQAWDSGGLSAGMLVAIPVLIGVGGTAVAILLGAPQPVLVTVLVTGFVLLTGARMVSPVSLNTLHVSLIVPAMYVFVVKGVLQRQPGSQSLP